MVYARRIGSLLVMLACAGAHGWNDTGHMVIALATWDGLAAETRGHYSGLLRQHPRYQQDFVARFPRGLAQSSAPTVDRWVFAMASTWPDYARSFHRERTAAAREQLMQRYHRSRWHYINLPTMLMADAKWQRSLAPPMTATDRSDPRAFNIVQALDAQTVRLRSSTLAEAERAIALCWVLHLVADLHQPLHTTALFVRGRFEQGDRGGNELLVEPEGNLHALWDRALGTTQGRRNLDSIAGELTLKPQEPQSSFAQWAREGQRVASRNVYTEAIRTAVAQSRSERAAVELDVDAVYRASAAQVSSSRAALAVTRLLRVLKPAPQSP